MKFNIKNNFLIDLNNYEIRLNRGGSECTLYVPIVFLFYIKNPKKYELVYPCYKN